jgi:hypothetical protein
MCETNEGKKTFGETTKNDFHQVKVNVGENVENGENLEMEFDLVIEILGDKKNQNAKEN